MLRVQAAILRLVGCPSHVVFAPLKGIFAQLLFFRIAILGRHFLPRLILFLIFLVGSVLFILLPALVLTLVFLFLVLSDGAKLRVKIVLALEGVDFGRHGHNLFVVGRFGTPLTCILEIVEVGLRKGHENFVGQGECPVEVAIMLLLHVGLKLCCLPPSSLILNLKVPLPTISNPSLIPSTCPLSLLIRRSSNRWALLAMHLDAWLSTPIG